MKVFNPKLARDIKDYFLDYNAKIKRTPRPFTEFLVKQFGNKKLTGLEIGFFEGKNAFSLLSELNIAKLYCVDPFLFMAYKENGRYLNTKREFDHSKYELLKLEPRVQFILKTSDEAFGLYGFKDLDFVYIDGNHETDFCFRDLVNSWNSLKMGGFVGGHDFTTQFENTVVPAIFRFAVNFKVEPTIGIPDFWFKKVAK